MLRLERLLDKLSLQMLGYGEYASHVGMVALQRIIGKGDPATAVVNFTMPCSTALLKGVWIKVQYLEKRHCPLPVATNVLSINIILSCFIVLWCFYVKFLQLHVPRRRLRPAPAASFKEDTLVELLKLRLAKDPERSELKIEEIEEMEMEVGLDQWMG